MNRCTAASAAFQSQACSASSACIRRGVACPAASASCQHDLRSPGSASSALMYPNAVNRDLACANTPASSANSSRLSSASQAPSSTMAPAATSLSCLVTKHDHGVAARAPHVNPGHTAINLPLDHKPGL